MTTTMTTTCPAWCMSHPVNETETHQSATWQGYGLSVVIERARGDALSFEVDKGGSEYLSLTAEQAHELGMELVRAADAVRRETLR